MPTGLMPSACWPWWRGQDVEPAPRGAGSVGDHPGPLARRPVPRAVAPKGYVAYRQKLAKDRAISTVDPEARHRHKSVSVRNDGYKGHLWNLRQASSPPLG